MSAAVFATHAAAQVERRELPVLQGEPPPPDQGLQPPPAGTPAQPGGPMLLQPRGEPDQPVEPAPVPGESSPAIPAAPEAASMPMDAWRGMEPAELEKLLANTPQPIPSPSLADALAEALSSGVPASRTEGAIRADALERNGRISELVALVQTMAQSGEPQALARYAAALLAEGRDKDACATELGSASSDVAARAKRAAFLVPAFCAALSGDRSAALLALNLARDNGVDTSFANAALGGAKPPPLPKSLDVLDYLFLVQAKAATSPEIAARASSALLYRLAHDNEAAPALKLAAAEKAASLNVIDGETLGQAYRETAPSIGKSQSASSLRARLFVALAGQQDPATQAESIDALMASAKDAKIELPMAEALAPAVAALAARSSGGLAEAGVRVAALAGDDQTAWSFSEAGASRSWQLLLAAADPKSEQARAALAEGVAVATKSQLPGALLQRLVTVLDALGEDIPIPLWDLAGKSPQPEDGYLPATGVLTSLKDASDKGEAGRTIILVATALGPQGAAGAHLIALGDSIRALKRVGLDGAAQRIAVEALYPHWPSRGKG